MIQEEENRWPLKPDITGFDLKQQDTKTKITEDNKAKI